MPRTRVKICGVTTADDARLACAAGADAIGMVFHPPASRSIATDTAREILRVIPPFVTPVGLFLDTTTKTVVATAGELGLRCVQLHGHETPEFVRELAQFSIIKAIHVLPGKLREALEPWRAAAGLENLVGLVLETGWGAAKGGTGIENDWDQIAAIRDEGGFEGLPPIIIAGGLRPETVDSVIRLIRPHAVDVSSGVERVRGRKDSGLIESFMHAVRVADYNSRHPERASV